MSNTDITPREVDDGEIQLALELLAANHGDVEVVAGLSDHSATLLLQWRDVVYRDRYERACAALGGQMEGELTSRLRSVALQAAQGQQEALTQTMEQLQQKIVEDPSAVAARLSQVGAKAVDQVMALTDRPREGTKVEDGDNLIRSLIADGTLRPVGGGEVIDAEVDEDA